LSKKKFLKEKKNIAPEAWQDQYKS
jgi:hypothetical protein